MTTVSVIVPVYNPGADIDDCVRSLVGCLRVRRVFDAVRGLRE